MAERPRAQALRTGVAAESPSHLPMGKLATVTDCRYMKSPLWFTSQQHRDDRVGIGQVIEKEVRIVI